MKTAMNVVRNILIAVLSIELAIIVVGHVFWLPKKTSASTTETTKPVEFPVQWIGRTPNGVSVHSFLQDGNRCYIATRDNTYDSHTNTVVPVLLSISCVKD